MSDLPTFQSIKSNLRTGDILLFHGPGFESKLIEWEDKSPYSHVGMVVLLEGTDHNRPLFWESSEITILEDFLDDSQHGGVHLVDLEALLEYTATKTSKRGEHYSYAWRALRAGSTTNINSNLEAFMQEVDAKAFPSLKEMALHFLEGRVHIHTSMETYFCSELAADTYQHLTLLEKEPPPNYYSPGSFSEANYELNLLNGASLAPEVKFTI